MNYIEAKGLLKIIGFQNINDLYDKCTCKNITNFNFVNKRTYREYRDRNVFEEYTTLEWKHNVLQKLFIPETENIVFKIWVIYENLHIDLYPLYNALIDLYSIKNQELDNYNSYYFESYIQQLDNNKKFYEQCATFFINTELIKFIILDYDNLVNKYKLELKEEHQKELAERDSTIKQKIGNYFNFLELNSNEYENELKNYINVSDKQRYKIKDLNTYSFEETEKRTYGVLMFKENKVVDIFFTIKVSEFVGRHLEKHKGDSVFIHELKNKEFANTLKAELCEYYDLDGNNGNVWKMSNYKYSTLKKAKFCYLRRYGISNKAFKKIEMENCFVKLLPTGDVIINKIKLHECVKATIKDLEDKLKEKYI